MRTRTGPNFANWNISYVKAQIFSPILDLYGCYIDDCVGVTCLSREQLCDFIAFVSALLHSLVISSNIPTPLLISWTSQFLVTVPLTLLSCPTSSNPPAPIYTSIFSSNLFHKNCTIPYFQFLRLPRLFSCEQDFYIQSQYLSHLFMSCDYPSTLVWAVHLHAREIDRPAAISPSPHKIVNCIP